MLPSSILLYTILTITHTAKAISKYDRSGKGFLTYDEFLGLIANFKLKFTDIQLSEVGTKSIGKARLASYLFVDHWMSYV